MMQQLGMDATVFIRFTNMCRNMFLVLALIGIAILVPVNYTKSVKFESDQWIMQITPLNVYDQANWAQVVVAYLFNITICFFLWWNYRKILDLRKKYFASEEYQNSLHARTLMLYDLPKQGCTDEGIARIIDQVAPNSSFARTVVARNVRDLPELIKEHDKTVRELEKVLARYMKDPQHLPAERPKCKPSKRDRNYETLSRGQKVDAIEYLTQRIRDLEVEIKEVRASVDKRGSMPYGFASYSDILEAHNIAYAARKKKPHGTTIRLAPRPNDIIWPNMPLSSASRSRKRWVNTLWVTLLTVLWIAPNAMIAIFLVNLTNLGKVWHAFNTSLEAHTAVWGVAQGILAPALTSTFYLILPIIFRRLSQNAGDQTKTGRERHVLAKLYNFFVFNNLIVFSFFSVIWSFVASVVYDTKHGTDPWHAILKANIAQATFIALCRNSPFWVTYLLQRQLGAAIDLSQLWPLIYAFFLKRFSSPTPRELIELTAPPPFEYASYYNYFLYYATVTLCFSGIQPLVLLATALYFTIDCYLKRYLLLYRFVTKTESGGVFWRVVFNRFIFATILSNLVVLLICWVRGDGQHIQFYACCPLPFIMVGFKFYCKNAYDNKIQYLSTTNMNKHPEANLQKETRLRNDKLAARFGHPALYRPLITPMVHSKAQNLLPAIYKGRLTDGRDADAGDMMTISGYSDMYALDAMQGGKTGKTAKGGSIPGFEYVSENHMDFEYFKNREEFADEHGGGGELYMGRPGTPGSFGDGSEFGGRGDSPNRSGRSSPFAPGQPRRQFTGDTSYAAFRPPRAETGFTQQQMAGSEPARGRFFAQDNGSTSGLVQNAADLPMGPPPGMQSQPHSRDGSMGRRTPVPAPGYQQRYATPPPQLPTPGPSMGALGGGPQGYSGLGQVDNENEDASQYDYFRSTRNNRRPGEGWQ